MLDPRSVETTAFFEEPTTFQRPNRDLSNANKSCRIERADDDDVDYDDYDYGDNDEDGKDGREDDGRNQRQDETAWSAENNLVPLSLSESRVRTIQSPKTCVNRRKHGKEATVSDARRAKHIDHSGFENRLVFVRSNSGLMLSDAV